MNNNYKYKKLTVTVGITTCYGDVSILNTVKSIRNSQGIKDFKFIIVADTVPISDEIKRELKKYNVHLVENKISQGQCPKKKQIISLCNSDLLVLTQDDILFEPKTLSTIVSAFEKDPNISFISIKKQPIKATNFFEDLTCVGTRISNRIAGEWNKGDNYLSVIGRCMAFRTDWINKFNMPDEVVSSDAYLYFENKRLGGKYVYLSKVSVIYKKTQNMVEHLRKSKRFQCSKFEMSKYFGNLDKYYQIPLHLILKSYLLVLLKSPIKTLLYTYIFIYTRLIKSDRKKVLVSKWEVDKSTKNY